MSPAEKRRTRRHQPDTRPNCPKCGEPLRRERTRGNHDRPALRFLACGCGYQEGHEVEREAVPA